MPNSITEVTRRKVMDLYTLLPIAWSGRLAEPDFLARLYPIRDLPSNDYRFNDAYGDVTQHRVNNPDDWTDDYIFIDPRFNLLWGTDENFLNFLEMTVHPVVLSSEAAASLVETYNTVLKDDGYAFRQDGTLSGHPLYKVGPTVTGDPLDAVGQDTPTAVELIDSTPHPQQSPSSGNVSIAPAVSITGGAPGTDAIASPPEEKRIFIVHGHDETAKNFVHLFLNRLTGKDAVVLHEQGNSGQSLIEKLENAADKVNFAVVLLTADDLGKAKVDIDLEPRGRQNVVFEMGYFMALLGRDKVAVLHATDVTEPGDMRGMLYIPYGSFSNDWKGKLAGELSDAGIDVDLKILTK